MRPTPQDLRPVNSGSHFAIISRHQAPRRGAADRQAHARFVPSSNRHPKAYLDLTSLAHEHCRTSPPPKLDIPRPSLLHAWHTSRTTPTNVDMPRHPGYQDGVNLVVSLALTYVICISCVRLWIRKGSYGSDDAVVAVATVVSFGHTAADYLALANGLGMPWRDSSLPNNLLALNTVGRFKCVRGLFR